MTTFEADQIRDAVQHRYADASRNVSSCCGSSRGPTAGSEGLPLTMVDGVTVITGCYPTRAQLTRYADLDQEPVVPASATTLALSDEDGCGCGSGGCC